MDYFTAQNVQDGVFKYVSVDFKAELDGNE
jgi:hypothetical protein